MELFVSNFFTDHNLTPVLNKSQLRSCDEKPRFDGLPYEPTTEVNGNDPYCKRVVPVSGCQLVVWSLARVLVSSKESRSRALKLF